MTNGWVMGRDNVPLFWVPVEHKNNLYMPSSRAVFGIPRKKATSVDLSNSGLGGKKAQCFDKEWLRELRRQEKEAESLLEKCVLSSAMVDEFTELVVLFEFLIVRIIPCTKACIEVIRMNY